MVPKYSPFFIIGIFFLSIYTSGCRKNAPPSIREENITKYIRTLENIRKFNPALIGKLASFDLSFWGADYKPEEKQKVEAAIKEAGFADTKSFSEVHRLVTSALRKSNSRSSLEKLDEWNTRDEERLNALIKDPHTPDITRNELQRALRVGQDSYDKSRAHMAEEVKQAEDSPKDPVVEAHRARLEKLLAVDEPVIVPEDIKKLQ